MNLLRISLLITGLILTNTVGNFAQAQTASNVDKNGFAKHKEAAVNNYNQAVEVVLSVKPESSVEEISNSQDKARSLFRQAYDHAKICNDIQVGDEDINEILEKCRLMLSENGKEKPEVEKIK